MARAVDLMRGFLTDDGQYFDTLPDRQVAQSMMEQRRRQEMYDRMDAAVHSPYPQVATNFGPLSDPAWDGFFGAMAMRENAANAKGGRFKVDYMGEGPGTNSGFGFYKANVDNGVSYNLADQNAGSDLARAAEAAKKAREEQAARAVENKGGDVVPREQDYGIFGQQGVSDSVEEAAAEGAPPRKPVQDAPRPKPQPSTSRRRAPLRRYGGSYTSPR